MHPTPTRMPTPRSSWALAIVHYLCGITACDAAVDSAAGIRLLAMQPTYLVDLTASRTLSATSPALRCTLPTFFFSSAFQFGALVASDTWGEHHSLCSFGQTMVHG